MAAPPSSPLSAEHLVAIGNLELAARMVVEGVLAGGHRSVRRGAGAEFQQHRPYRPGDDLKHLDWKLLARTERLHTRQFRETTRLDAMIVVDTSGSMGFPESGVSKLSYARVLAAALAHVIITQGDAAGLMSMAGGRLSYLPARGGRAHLRGLIARVDRLESHGAWAPARAITRAAELLQRRGVLIVISDFYDDEDATRAALRRAARAGHDVAMLQVMAAAELALPYTGNLEFEDMESGARRLVDAGASAAAYASAVQDFLARCRAAAVRDGMDYAFASTADDPSRVLRGFLLRRAASAGMAGAR